MIARPSGATIMSPIQTHTSQAFGLTTAPQVNTLQMPEMIDLTIGEPRLSALPTEFVQKLTQIQDIQRYYPAQGSVSLRQSLIEKFYPQIQLQQICITHGAIGALDLILRAICNPGDHILLPDPGFPPYEKLAQFSKVNVSRYRLNSCEENLYAINWNSVTAALTPYTRLIILNSPSNPTGQLFTKRDKLKLIEILQKYPQLSFVMDEVYREMIFEGEHTETSDLIDRGFVVGSFSKMYPLAGARIGWLIGNEKQLQKIYPYLSFAFGSMSSFGQELALQFLQTKANFSERYHQVLNLIIPVLDHWQIKYVKPHGGFFLWIQTPYLGSELTVQLLQLGLKVVPGESFGPSGAYFIRVCFSQEPEILKQGLDRLGRYLQELSV